MKNIILALSLSLFSSLALAGGPIHETTFTNSSDVPIRLAESGYFGILTNAGTCQPLIAINSASILNHDPNEEIDLSAHNYQKKKTFSVNISNILDNETNQDKAKQVNCVVDKFTNLATGESYQIAFTLTHQFLPKYFLGTSPSISMVEFK